MCTRKLKVNSVAYPLFDYQKLFHTLPTRFIVFAADNPTFTIVEESDAHAEMVAMRRADVIGRPLFDVFPDTSERHQKTGVSDLIESLRTVIRTKQPHTMEIFRYDIKTADGSFSERYWQATHYPVLSEDGKKVVLIFQATNDITHEHLANSHLKRTEKNLRFMAQANVALAGSLNYTKTLQTIAKKVIPDIADWCGIDILNPKTGRIEQVAITHKDPAKIRWAKELRQNHPINIDDPNGSAAVIRTGRPEFYPVVTPELIAATSGKKQLKILKEIGINSVIIVPLKIKDQTVGTISLVLNEQGRHYTPADFEMAQELANRASLAMTNATLFGEAQDELVKRRELEDKLRVANERLESRVRERTAQLEATNASLEQSNRELQDFAYVASHDLQEPLRKIQAFGNLLESEYAERLGDGSDYLMRMRGAAARMSTLIEDLLQFSRVTTKAREFTTVDLNAIAHEVLSDLETRVQDTNGVVTIGTLPNIQADPLQMRQLLQNLIGNALKFHTADKTPVVRVNATIQHQKHRNTREQLCVIQVQDNGIGFDEKYLDRIFSVFQRLHSRENYEGTGIGLAVCRKIAERHGGTITAKSAPGKGATFIVTLPVRHIKRKGAA